MADEIYIDGKQVTERNASRFVKARQPNAAAVKQYESSWRHRRVYFIVRDRTQPHVSWCYASGQTAGKAWLKVAEQMLAHDAKVASATAAMQEVERALREAPGKSSALRYAAECLRQKPNVGTSDIEYLEKLAAEPVP